MIKTKSIYQPIEPEDGERLLVMRYWPRGVKKNRVSSWLKDLGPSAELIKKWKNDTLTWDDFKREYNAEFNNEERKKAFAGLKDALKNIDNLTLLCSCADENRCHRGILKAMLEDELT